MQEQLPFIPPVLQHYMDACWTEGYFSPEEVAVISGIFDAKDKKNAEVSDQGEIRPDLRKSTVAFLQPGEKEYKDILFKLANLAMQMNHQHYHFDLMGFYEPIQIAEYGIDDFFEWHTDFSNGAASTRKLSLSVQLSDPSEYEGGDLQFKINTEEINAPKTPGTVIVFPSFVAHRVTPITKGKRRSMVGWVTGTPFR